MTRTDRTNDGTSAAPRLRRDLNSGTLAHLPRASRGWRATFAEQLALVKADGYTAVQSWSDVENAGAIQTGLDDPGAYVMHHRLMWERCFDGFLRGAQGGDYLSFNPELLPMKIGDGPHALWLHYAQPRTDLADDAFGGEASDRYADAQRLWDMALECFEAARRRLNGSPTSC